MNEFENELIHILRKINDNLDDITDYLDDIRQKI